MENTEDRLLYGAKIYHDNAISKIYAEMQKPTILTYPNKVTKNFFAHIVDKGKNEFAIVFTQRTFYKKIERYRQVNYQKYPVYSSTLWKDKTMEIKIRPNPSLFNGLKISDNPDLAKNATLIIACFLDPKLYPSWAQEQFLDLAHKAKSEEIAASTIAKTKAAETELRAATRQLHTFEAELGNLLKRKESLEAAAEKCFQKILECGFHQHKYIVSILSLGLASPKRKAIRAKKKAASLQRELTSLLRQYEKKLIAYRQSVENEVKAKDALSEIKAQCAHSKAIEDVQFVFDKSNIHQPFIGAKPPSDPPMPGWDKAEAHYKFNSLTKKVTGEVEGFLPFDDPSFTKYYGFEVVGVIVIRNRETNTFLAGMTFDVGASLMKLMKVKGGRFKDKEMRRQWMAARSKEKLFDVLVIASPNKEALLGQLNGVLDAYLATFVAI